MHGGVSKTVQVRIKFVQKNIGNKSVVKGRFPLFLYSVNETVGKGDGENCTRSVLLKPNKPRIHYSLLPNGFSFHLYHPSPNEIEKSNMNTMHLPTSNERPSTKHSRTSFAAHVCFELYLYCLNSLMCVHAKTSTAMSLIRVHVHCAHCTMNEPPTKTKLTKKRNIKFIYANHIVRVHSPLNRIASNPFVNQRNTEFSIIRWCHWPDVDHIMQME